MAAAVGGEKGIEMAAPAAAADGEDGGGEKSAFRCIDVVRFAVASVVMVLIVSVIVNAIQVLLRPESLSLSVVRGTVSLRRTKPPASPVLIFDMDVRGDNPSGRARMYYLHVVGFLLDNNTSPLTSTPGLESIIYFGLNDKVVPQLGKVDMLKEVNVTRGKDISEDWFDRLYGSTDAAVAGVTLRLKGVLATEIYGLNKTRPVTHLCGPLLVGGDPDDEAYKNLADVLCAEATEIE
ncbi:hypothetical protein BS78_10G017900 [Paspalum vaginatum]|nr:hypothetical protein BS78_10G017900 [Paspalum vaginatum]